MKRLLTAMNMRLRNSQAVRQTAMNVAHMQKDISLLPRKSDGAIVGGAGLSIRLNQPASDSSAARPIREPTSIGDRFALRLINIQDLYETDFGRI